MVLLGALVVCIIHFVLALLTFGLIFRYLKKQTNMIYALLGVIFSLSLPIVVKLFENQIKNHYNENQR